MDTLQHLFASLVTLVVGLVASFSVGTAKPVAPVTTINQNKTAQEVSTTSPSEVKMEMINGISVPPEPDPEVNNATLAGVDVNGNGVRDDVERFIAAFSVKSTYDQHTLEMARLISSMVVENFTMPDEVNAINVKLYCLALKRPADEVEILRTTMLRTEIANTAKRKANYQKNHNLSPFGPEEVKCS